MQGDGDPKRAAPLIYERKAHSKEELGKDVGQIDVPKGFTNLVEPREERGRRKTTECESPFPAKPRIEDTSKYELLAEGAKRARIENYKSDREQWKGNVARAEIRKR